MRSSAYKKGETKVSELPSGTSFSNKKVEYEYDERTGEISPTGETVDLYEQIQSACVDTLDQLLQKYGLLPTLQQQASQRTQHLSDILDTLQDYSDDLEVIRDELKLDPSLSLSEILGIVEQEYNKSKEVQDNGKTQTRTSGTSQEPSTVQEHGSEDKQTQSA